MTSHALVPLSTDKEPSSPLGIPALSIVASTASSVALILLLVVLFVLVQPKLKSFHLSRYDIQLLSDLLVQDTLSLII